VLKNAQEDLSGFIMQQSDPVSFVLKHYDLFSQLPCEIINDSKLLTDRKVYGSTKRDNLYENLNPIRIKNELIKLVNQILVLDFYNSLVNATDVLNQLTQYLVELNKQFPDAQLNRYSDVLLKINDTGKTVAAYANKSSNQELIMLLIPSIKQLKDLQSQIKKIEEEGQEISAIIKLNNFTLLAKLRNKVGEDLAQNPSAIEFNNNLLYSLWYNGNDFLDQILKSYRGDVAQELPQRLKSEIANLISINFTTPYRELNNEKNKGVNIKSIYNNLAHSINTMVNLNILDKSLLLQTNDNKQTIAHYAIKHVKDSVQLYYTSDHNRDNTFELDEAIVNFLSALKPFANQLQNLKDNQGRLPVDYAKTTDPILTALGSHHKLSDLAEDTISRYGFNEVVTSCEMGCCNVNLNFLFFFLC
jgi:hypothetical protein